MRLFEEGREAGEATPPLNLMQLGRLSDARTPTPTRTRTRTRTPTPNPIPIPTPIPTPNPYPYPGGLPSAGP